MAPLASTFKNLVGLVANEQVGQFRQSIHSGDLEPALDLIRDANPSTRRAMMEDLCGQLSLNPTWGLPPVIEKMVATAIGLDVKGAWSTPMLHIALKAHLVPLAFLLLSHGADPHKVPSEGGNGPLTRLAHGDYKGVSPQDCVDLLSKMETLGGNLFRISPGGVEHPEVLDFLISRWPSPRNPEQWNSEGFVFDLNQSITHQASNPERGTQNIKLLLDAGFPFKPTEAIAEALQRECYENARFLLSLTSDEQLSDEIEDKPGATLWHVVSSAWASRRNGQLNLGWTDPEVWPPQDIIERLYAVDLEKLDEEEVSPLDLAMSLCGELGPMEAIRSQIDAKRLEDASNPLSSPAHNRPSRRL